MKKTLTAITAASALLLTACGGPSEPDTTAEETTTEATTTETTTEAAEATEHAYAPSDAYRACVDTAINEGLELVDGLPEVSQQAQDTHVRERGQRWEVVTDVLARDGFEKIHCMVTVDDDGELKAFKFLPM